MGLYTNFQWAGILHKHSTPTGYLLSFLRLEWCFLSFVGFFVDAVCVWGFLGWGGLFCLGFGLVSSLFKLSGT